MHELSVAQNLCRILDDVREQHRAVRVRRAVLEMGPLSNVVPELLEQAFATLREIEPTMARVELKIRRVPLTARCDHCGREADVEGFTFRCAVCGKDKLTLIRGEELTLRDVELEIEEETIHESGPTREDAGASAQIE